MIFMLGQSTSLDCKKGDNFKVIYKERFVDDSIYAGIETIEAAFFEHKGDSFYAFNYINQAILKTLLIILTMKMVPRVCVKLF